MNRQVKNVLLVEAALAIITGSFIIFNLPYFQEKIAANEVMAQPTIENCKEYFTRFPQGKHSTDISNLWATEVDIHPTVERCNEYLNQFPHGTHSDDISYLKATLYTDSNAVICKPVFQAYLRNFPQGKHEAQLNKLYDELWDAEIEKYHQRDKQNEAEKAVAYMSEMLQYMKQHRTDTLYVSIHSSLRLKDYEEYDASYRMEMEGNYDLPLRGVQAHMLSLKNNFTLANEETLNDMLREGVQSSLDEMFTPGFITVAHCRKDPCNAPMLSFNYKIATQEEHIGHVSVPQIWIYTVNNVPQNYLVGIAISFDARFTIPHSTTTYKFAARGEPEQNIHFIDNVRDGYWQMTSMCFTQFTNKMVNTMGLKEGYTKEDKENSVDTPIDYNTPIVAHPFSI